MTIAFDRDGLIEVLGGEEKAAALTDEQRAEVLDNYLLAQLNDPRYLERTAAYRADAERQMTVRRGIGAVFGDGYHIPPDLPPMPKRPTLIDFLRLRTILPFVRHSLQSAEDARSSGGGEEEQLACLLHDLGQSLMRVDHGWWCAQMIEPYVSDEITFAVRYHQALRFYPDESVGYSYPEIYDRIWGKSYVPEPYIEEAYQYARGHRFYMAARMVTVHDLYAFDPDKDVSLDPFIDVIGRHFRQPAEGLGFDRSPVAHMWRSVIFPDHPL